MSAYISDKEIEEIVSIEYLKQKRDSWSNMSEIEKSRTLAKKIVYRLGLVKGWLFEMLSYVSGTIAIDMLLEEAEREGLIDRNKINEAIYRRRKKI